jgi:hypothetical protein
MLLGFAGAGDGGSHYILHKHRCVCVGKRWGKEGDIAGMEGACARTPHCLTYIINPLF